MGERVARAAVPARPGLFTRFQVIYGEWRQRLVRRYAREGDRQVDGFAGDLAYCERLLAVYDEMRSAPSEERRSRLLSHVPEWAQSLQVADEISDEGFELAMVRAVPRLQAALANCTSYSPSKWLLEQEMTQRYANRAVAGPPWATVSQGFTAESALREGAWTGKAANLQVDGGGATPASARENLLSQELARRANTAPPAVDPKASCKEYLQQTQQADAWTEREWAFEQEFAVRCADRLVSEAPLPPPRDADDLIRRLGEWSGGAPSWSPGKDVFEAAADEQLAGLCLSGGGIRSATFCLGILQTLAERDLLRRFDYLSSVSGGGYIHQWLAAWIHREPRGLASVQLKMMPLPSSGSLARAPEQINWLRRYSSYLTPQRGLFTADTWTVGAIWFRNTFLNQIILFSFFAVVLVFVRAVMHPFTMAAGPNDAEVLTVAALVNDGWQWVFGVAALICVVWAFRGVAVFAKALASQTKEPEGGGQPPEGAIDDGTVIAMLVVPGFLLSFLVALAAAGVFRVHDLAAHTLAGWHRTYTSYAGGVHLLLLVWAAYVAALLVAVTVGGRAMETSLRMRRAGHLGMRRLGFAVAILFCTLLPMGVVIVGATHGFRGASVGQAAEHLSRDLNRLLSQTPQLPAAVKGVAVKASAPRVSIHRISPGAVLALLFPLLFFGAQFMAIRLNLGLLGRAYEESRREWLARYGAWAAILSFLWLALGSVTLIGPAIYYWFFDFTLTREFVSAGVVTLIHAVTVYAGSSSKTSGVPDPRKFFGYTMLDLVGIIGAPIAILSLLIVTSGWVDIVTDSSYHQVERLLGGTQGAAAVVSGHWAGSLLHYGLAVSGPVIAFVVYSSLLLLFGWRVDVNEFSLHPFYRDRLARCYNGASNGARVPDPFTGFDDHMEVSYNSIALAELLPARFGGQPNGEQPPYDGPMPIFCSTVNLTFGEDLAFQDRKGTSFAFTPLYSGYHVSWTAERESGSTTTYNGFVRTEDYAYRQESLGLVSTAGSGIPLMTVAAISGAALSPNQGYSSQPTLAFLMTLFNARLGWWIANPRKPWIWPNELDQPTPRFGLRYLLAELFGYSNDTSNYVSLADGGRFDNMGLYELVRRRCTRIVICDGEQDDETTFEGLGLAVAKARIDFGVEIDFVPGQMEALAPDPETGRSQRHFALGRIKYPAPPGGDADDPKYVGEIVYLKTAYVGDEPVDLLHYKREHPDFPQEKTLNQWFTEPQFESYRRLGQLTAELAFPKAP